MPLNFNFGQGLQDALGGLGGNYGANLQDILGQIDTKPYFQGLPGYGTGTVDFGLPQLQGLLPNIQNPHRQMLFNDILGWQPQNNPVDPVDPPPPPTGQPPLNLSFLPGIQRALGILGGDSDQRFRDILTSIQTKPYLQGLIKDGGLSLGIDDLPGLLGVIENPHRQQFIQSIIKAAQGNNQNNQNNNNQNNNQHNNNGNPYDFSGIFKFPEGAFNLSELPNFQLIQDTIEKWLSGDNPLEPVNVDDPLGSLRGLTEKKIRELMNAEGLPQHIIDAAENTISSRLKSRERDQIRTSGERAAGRGIFDSGLLERATRDIQDSTDQTLAEQLSELGLMNAREAAGQRQLGLQGANLLGNLGLATQSLGIQGGLGARGQDLQALSTALGGLLGMGNLELSNIQTDLQRQLEEFRMGLLANGLLGNGEGDPDPNSIPDWLGNLLTGKGGFLGGTKNPLPQS